ncbi:MAG: 4'-phosphopantetheinyl transferase superfamily protein [Acetobacteraceae bacterium]
MVTEQDVQLCIFPLHPKPGDADLLAPDEQRHADAFHFALHRDRYIAGRAMLRRLLAARLARDPASLRFHYGKSGKPALDEPISFNFSNSDDLGALAIAAFELGVDIERVRVIEEDVAGRFFAADEVARLRSLPIEQQTGAFFNCWTRKEAYIKALGDGLSLSLDRFSVTLAPNEPPRLLRAGDDPSEPGSWRLHHFVPAPGFVGAIAARQLGWRVRLGCLKPGCDPVEASSPALPPDQP